MNGVFLIINYEDTKIESFGEKTNEIIDEIVITAGYHQIKEENGKIVRIDKNGTVLDQLTEERYNKIKRKADQNKLHENEGR